MPEGPEVPSNLPLGLVETGTGMPVSSMHTASSSGTRTLEIRLRTLLLISCKTLENVHERGELGDSRGLHEFRDVLRNRGIFVRDWLTHRHPPSMHELTDPITFASIKCSPAWFSPVRRHLEFLRQRLFRER